MKRILICIALNMSLLIVVKAQINQKSRTELPNFVFIFADDLGYGDLSCFGAKDIATPNIDQIAKEGIRFTDFYSASSICSPSRAAFLTGRLPQRMGINGVFFPGSYTGMSPAEITIAEVLKEKNYTSGIVGKWHLGHRDKYLPLQQGFDSYFGIPYSNDMSDLVFLRGNEVESFDIDQKFLTKTYTTEAINFIEKNKEKPFFLYLAHNMPHVPIYASPDFVGKSKRGLYGDVVQELDWSVGQVIKKLEELDLIENTLIIFSSDNGPWLAMKELGGSAGILREGKMYTFEGGMRVPTVAMWKGKIKPNTICTDLASQMDWFPTFAKLAGIPLPQNLIIDGKEITGVLLNTSKRESNEYFYFDGADLQAYRNGDWKIKKPYAGFEGKSYKNAVAAHDTLLFNLKDDPGEKNNLLNENRALVKNLFSKMNFENTRFGNFPSSLKMSSKADGSHNEYLKINSVKD